MVRRHARIPRSRVPSYKIRVDRSAHPIFETTLVKGRVGDTLARENRIFASDLGSFSGMARTENQVFHRQRYREAAEAIGKIGSHVLEWAVCREIGLEQIGYALGWGSRAH